MELLTSRAKLKEIQQKVDRDKNPELWALIEWFMDFVITLELKVENLEEAVSRLIKTKNQMKRPAALGERAGPAGGEWSGSSFKGS